MGIVKFNEKSSEDLGLIVQFKPSYTYPEKEYEKLHIPGRNGDLVLDKGSYQNVEKTYSMAKVFKPGQDFIASASSITAWLHSANGYARLEDSYEPEYYRMALYKSNGEMSNYYDAATALDVTFECKPQRWLKSGEISVQINSGESLKNPTTFDASPIITLTTTATSVNLNVGDIAVQLINVPANTEITIDCENMECYSGNKLYNSSLKLLSGSFPVLKGSITTEITFTNAINVTIKPRWWTL